MLDLCRNLQVARLLAINLQHVQVPHLRKRAAKVLEAVQQLAQPDITEDEVRKFILYSTYSVSFVGAAWMLSLIIEMFQRSC